MLRSFTRISALTLLAALVAGGVRAQVPVFVTTSAGAAIDIDETDPVTGGGFAFLGGAGLHFPRVAFGAEFGQHSLGHDRKAKQYGLFVRLPAVTTGRVRPYLVVGVADYRYSPATGRRTRALGGSLGPGVAFRVATPRAAINIETRFHSSFDQIGTISSQDFVGVTMGLDLAF
jgi:hypothetical protein